MTKLLFRPEWSDQNNEIAVQNAQNDRWSMSFIFEFWIFRLFLLLEKWPDFTIWTSFMQLTVPATISIRYSLNIWLGKWYLKYLTPFHQYFVPLTSLLFYFVLQRLSRSCFLFQIKIPVLLLNALDDPLVPEELFITPYNHVSKYCLNVHQKFPRQITIFQRSCKRPPSVNGRDHF